MSDQPLITKYRPQTFDEVLGHSSVLRGLQKALSGPNRPHAFLFTGPSGVGKTTLARIIAQSLGSEVLEIDAATHNGVDAVREIVELATHGPLTGATKMFIFNEAQRFSRPAWDALLMLLEEPPAHLYIAITTTEAGKVPDAVSTRCYPVALGLLKDQEVLELITVVSEIEEWKVPGDVLNLVVQAATGQPRKALAVLQAVWNAPSAEEARRIVRLQTEDSPVISLLNPLVRGEKVPWERMRDTLKRILDEEDDFEAVFVLAGRFLMSAMLRADEGRAQAISSLLESLVFPATTVDRRAAFVAAIARYRWGS